MTFYVDFETYRKITRIFHVIYICIIAILMSAIVVLTLYYLEVLGDKEETTKVPVIVQNATKPEELRMCEIQIDNFTKTVEFYKNYIDNQKLELKKCKNDTKELRKTIKRKNEKINSLPDREPCDEILITLVENENRNITILDALNELRNSDECLEYLEQIIEEDSN